MTDQEHSSKSELERKADNTFLIRAGIMTGTALVTAGVCYLTNQDFKDSFITSVFAGYCFMPAAILAKTYFFAATSITEDPSKQQNSH